MTYKVTITHPTIIVDDESGERRHVEPGDEVDVTRRQAFDLLAAGKCGFNEEIRESEAQDAKVHGPHKELVEQGKSRARAKASAEKAAKTEAEKVQR